MFQTKVCNRLKFIALLILLAVPAHGTVLLEVAPVVGGNFSMPRVTELGGTSPTQVSSKLGISYGALLYIPAFPGFSFETGALYLNHKHAITSSAGTVSQKAFANLMFPLMLRFTALPFLSFGGGGYLAQGIGEVASQDPTSGNTLIETSFDSAGLSKFDFGGIVGASLDVPILPLTSLLLDVNYYLGLKNLATQGGDSSFKLGGFLILAGVKIGL